MIIKAIVIPTPKRIKKKFKALEKDEIFLYSLIGGGIFLVSLTEMEHKLLPILGLSYCGAAYTYLRNLDDKTLNAILKESNNIYSMRYFD